MSESKKERFSKIKQMVEKGAAIQINPEKSSLTDLSKNSVNINPLYLPKFKFWNAPDVKIGYRSICRSLLRLWSKKEPKNLSFEDVCRANGVTDHHLNKIERRLWITACIAFIAIPISLITAIYFNNINTWLTALGSMVIASAWFWKYSFQLWQVRLRSLDKNDASVRAFMRQSWYLEIFK
ncbi:MAG: hypothetical protein CTY35_00550 [Methylotenera sp.]|uniref:hypothetical protein n=1 Tax=Methylotenera sp. TaxID=2051956 RepID=UPI000D4F434F|nr:hypothetical protein [Methylotenera sp.]PPC84845.1 MAG: hypothetical protein CTY38_00545 [Methylotenera sp.]PPD02205.1 MAG: hypothetical protein CTY35_00550 [Methylotenera sp.]